MSRLLNILENIQETESAIIHLQNNIAVHPKEQTFPIALESLYMRQKNLQEDFALLAHEEYKDVCSYRMIMINEKRPKLSSIGKALTDFQELFTTMYDAIKNGPKQRVSYTEEIAQESALEFGYSFSGSIGFILTMPNERLLFGETDLDKAMNMVFELAKTHKTEEIRSMASSIGVAPVRKIYAWANDHIQAGLDVEIQWKRNNEVRSNLLIQQAELVKLQQTIDEISVEEPIEIEVTGKLIGGDMKTGKFHMSFEDSVDIIGKLGEGVTIASKKFDDRYTAKLLKVSKVYYSIEKEDVSYTLLDLKPPAA